MSRSHVATEWDLLFVEDDGVYISTNFGESSDDSPQERASDESEDANHVNAFKIAGHDDLLSRDDELARSYQASMTAWESDIDD